MVRGIKFDYGLFQKHFDQKRVVLQCVCEQKEK